MSEPQREWLTAAECAARTGLTVRALRVYERYGLIVPQRTASGWRRYGSQELTRLNTITVLKSAGLTLAQIRDLLDQKEPSAEDVLRAQIEACKAREDAARRGRAIAELALVRLQTHQSLSIDELCKLVRSHEMNHEMSHDNPILRQLRDKYLTAEEQQAWTAHQAQEQPHLQSMEAYQQAQQREIFAEISQLIAVGEQPSSARAQQLVIRNNQLLTQYGVREAMLRSHEWDPQITRKTLRVGAELFLQASVAPGNPQLSALVPDPKVYLFFAMAVRDSAHRQKIETLLGEVRQLIDAQIAPAAPEPQAIAERFKEICREHFLGDPQLYARWAPFHRLIPGPQSREQYKESWDYVVRALSW